MKRVGILGGMGPDATVLLMQKVIAGVNVDDDHDHIPMIVHQNTQVPSRIKRLLEGNGDNPAPVLKQMALELEQLNCDLLAMPCNTAHYYYDEICEKLSVPLLNMIQLSAKTLFEHQLSRIGILASPAVKQLSLFEGFFKCYDLESHFPDDDDRLLKIIKAIKNGSLNQSIIEEYKSQVFRLKDLNCDGFLVACTELSILKPHMPKSITFLDSLDCLAEAIILKATNK